MGSQIEGQMSIFDFLEKPKTNEPLVLLNEGEIVYKVVKGDIETYLVSGSNWTCGEGNRGYSLDGITSDSGRHSVTWNTRIGVDVFKNYEEALKEANKNLEELEHILASDVKPVKVVGYSYIYSDFYKNGTDREIIDYYAILDNGIIYLRTGSKYEHCYKNIDTGIKEFEADKAKLLEHHGDIKELINYEPQLKNMYKVKHSDWDYAEARFDYLMY